MFRGVKRMFRMAKRMFKRYAGDHEPYRIQSLQILTERERRWEKGREGETQREKGRHTPHWIPCTSERQELSESHHFWGERDTNISLTGNWGRARKSEEFGQTF